ncbi:MAG: hypothetical protein KC643_22585 [Nitrospira sp.]|nr:hypothetical protein [Nitrospira sp.]
MVHRTGIPHIATLVTILTLGCGSFALGATMSLQEAVHQGKVTMTIKGLGGSTGDAIVITLKRTVSESLRLILDPGTVLPSASRTVQDMVAARVKGEQTGEYTYRPSQVIELRDDREHAYLVEAYCLDFHKDNPGSADRFQLGTIDERAKAILEGGAKQQASMNVLQSAIWIDREHVSDATLKQRFPVSDADIVRARSLLNSLVRK